MNAVVEEDGRVLVSRRSPKETHEPGKWTVPAGKVERTAGSVWNIVEKTLADEVREENELDFPPKAVP